MACNLAIFYHNIFTSILFDGISQSRRKGKMIFACMAYVRNITVFKSFAFYYLALTLEEIHIMQIGKFFIS